MGLRDTLARIADAWRSGDTPAVLKTLATPEGNTVLEERGLSRRAFLGALATGAAGSLLWTPGASTIWLPPSSSLAISTPGNGLVTSEWIARECLRIFDNSLLFSKQVNRDYDRRFGFARVH